MFVENILKGNTEQIQLHLCLSHYTTNRLNIQTRKEKRKLRETLPAATPVLHAKLIYPEKAKKILSLFTAKRKQKVNSFNYLNQYCNVKMALIIEGIFLSKTVTSLQIKVHECYVKPLKLNLDSLY